MNTNPTPVNMGTPQEASQTLVYTLAEASALLQLSYASVCRLIQRRKLRCLGSLRHKRIPRTEIDRFLNEDLS